MNKPTFNKKCVVVGDGAVGKTCLLLSFVADEFPLDYIPTVFETYVATMDMGDSVVKLAIWDTAGQEDFERLRMLSYPDSDVVAAVFAIDSVESYENIRDTWTKEINQYNNKAVKILVASKIDLRKCQKTINKLAKKNLKPITTEQTEEMCHEIKFDSYFEVSAKSKVGMKELFQGIASMSYLVKRRRKFSCAIL